MEGFSIKTSTKKSQGPKLALKFFPVRPQEQRFVNFLVIHPQCWFRAVEGGEIRNVEGLAKDMRAFFSLPIPRRVWGNQKTFQDANFVEFVDSSMNPSQDNAQGPRGMLSI